MGSLINMMPFVNEDSIFNPDRNKKKIKEPTSEEVAKAEKEE